MEVSCIICLAVRLSWCHEFVVPCCSFLLYLQPVYSQGDMNIARLCVVFGEILVAFQKMLKCRDLAHCIARWITVSFFLFITHMLPLPSVTVALLWGKCNWFILLIKHGRAKACVDLHVQ